MKSQQKILFTYDYELFLGDNTGSILNCIIKPTNEILKLHRKYNAAGIFFIDVIYLNLLKKYAVNDFNEILNQLKAIVEAGSFLGLHLHTHWLDANYSNGKFYFKKYDRYRMHSLDEDDLRRVFSEGINLLEEVSKKKILFFRAGGWSIMPFSRVKQLFLEFGVRYDFSVIPGYYINKIPLNYADYRSVDKGLTHYYFDDEVTEIKEIGGFVEIPVTTFKVFGLLLLLNKLLILKSNNIIFGDGSGIKKNSVKSNISKIFKINSVVFKVEGYSKLLLKLGTRLCTKELITFVIHPKSMSINSLENMDYLLKSYSYCDLKEIINLSSHLNNYDK